MRQRKRVIMALAMLEKKLWSQQAQVNKHKGYFLTLLHGNPWVVPALLVPAFIIGWRSARTRHLVRFIRHLAKFLTPIMLAL